MSKSKIFLYLCFSFILGILLFSFFNVIPLYVCVIGISIFLVLLIVWRENPKIKLISLCGLFFILGIVRFLISVSDNNFHQLSFYNDKEELKFQGIVSDEPDIREDNIKLIIKATNIKQNDSLDKMNGKILVTVPRFPEYRYGDLLEITCDLKTPPEFDDFSYKNYLAKSNIYSICYSFDTKVLDTGHGSIILSFLFNIKNRFEDVINKILPEPHASFLAGVILGSKHGIPPDLKNAFSITGTSHIIVVSGFQVTIVAGLLIYLMQIFFVPRKYSFWFSVAGLLLFILLTGACPSSIRAGVMGGIVLLALHSGRLTDTKNIILCAVIIMLLINPKVLRFDIGFQLSFLATVGIIYLTPYLKKVLKFLPEIFKIREAASMTLSAQIFTLPVIVYNFEKISLVSLPVNILIVPLIPLTTIIGFLNVILGVTWLFLGKIFSIITWSLLQYEIFTVNIFSRIPYASLEIKKIWFGWIIVYYLVVIIIIWVLKKRERTNLRVYNKC